jgi:purine-nucleoside phosphorylase
MFKNNTNFAVILGSGLDSLTDNIRSKTLLEEDTGGIHRKRIYKADINGKSIIFFCGRRHFYEGSPINEIISDVRFASDLGVKYLLVTNAAGGLNPNFKETDLMLIHSHINLNRSFFYEKKKLDYDRDLEDKFLHSCIAAGVKCYRGIYGFLPGPAYETRSEITMLIKFNIDAVGMSTIPELFAASQLGLKCIAVSVITNILKENTLFPANHDHVVNSAKTASPGLFSVILRFINELN